MGGTRDYRMLTTDALLRAAVSGTRDDDLLLTLDAGFQGLPDTAHGGTLLALFDALAGGEAPREIVGHYRRRVPLGVPLKLAVARAGDAVGCRVHDAAGAVLVEGRIEPAITTDGIVATASTAATPLPISRTCFACGIDNPIGLRARLTADERSVAGTWTPTPGFVSKDGLVAPVALTTLLDEAAFGLGALATGESGMTTEVRVTLHRPVAAGGALHVVGERAAARPHADDARYWDTTVVATDARGHIVATATITFVTIRGAARRLVRGLLELNPAEIVHRVFPAYAE
jgi:acyl-coenzyme A thioesterase PaaI-like protein